MKRLTFIFCALSFLALASCSSDSAETATNTQGNQLMEVAKIDSVTTVLQQTEVKLQKTEKALDAALNDLDL